MKVFVAKSCLILWDPMDYSPLASSINGILQVRIVEWLAIPFSKESSQANDQTQLSCTAGGFFSVCATREALILYKLMLKRSSLVLPLCSMYCEARQTKMWELGPEKVFLQGLARLLP